MEHEKLGSYSQFRIRIRWNIAVSLCIAGTAILATMGALTLADEQNIVGIMDLLFTFVCGVCLIYLLRGDKVKSSRIFFLLTAFIVALLPILSILQGKSFHYWFYLFPLCIMFVYRFVTATWLSIAFGIYATATVSPVINTIDTIRVGLSYFICLGFMMTYAFLEERAIEMLKFYSHHDPLTNCLNRRTFNEQLEAVSSDQSPASRASVLLIDVDHFKQINDQHGHLVGDRVITEIATVMSQHLRADTPLYRYGGEEFVVLLLDCEPGRGATLAERLRSAVEAHQFADGMQLTISIGISNWIREGLSIEESLNAADTALYQAKDGGRNQIKAAA